MGEGERSDGQLGLRRAGPAPPRPAPPRPPAGYGGGAATVEDLQSRAAAPSPPLPHLCRRVWAVQLLLTAVCAALLLRLSSSASVTAGIAGGGARGVAGRGGARSAFSSSATAAIAAGAELGAVSLCPPFSCPHPPQTMAGRPFARPFSSASPPHTVPHACLCAGYWPRRLAFQGLAVPPATAAGRPRPGPRNVCAAPSSSPAPPSPVMWMTLHVSLHFMACLVCT